MNKKTEIGVDGFGISKDFNAESSGCIKKALNIFSSYTVSGPGWHNMEYLHFSHVL